MVVLQKTLLAALLIGGASVAPVNSVEKLTLDEMTARSDLVVVGHAVSPESNGSIWGTSTSRIAIDTVMKGEAPSEIVVYTRTGVAELNLQCCESDAHYILFLVRSDDRAYAGVNGPYSTVRLP